MKYMLLMNTPAMTGDQDWVLPPEDLKRTMEHIERFNQDLVESGEFVTTEGLAGVTEAKKVTAGKDGKPEVTDGPFLEAKEFLAGFWIVDCESPERAYEIAARLSAIPGGGGQPSNLPIEVRAVMTHTGVGD